MAKQNDYVRVTLRIPRELHQKLLKAAQTSSMNSEIINRLSATFSKGKSATQLDPTSEDINEHDQMAWDAIDTATSDLNEATKHLLDWESRILGRKKRKR